MHDWIEFVVVSDVLRKNEVATYGTSVWMALIAVMGRRYILESRTVNTPLVMSVTAIMKRSMWQSTTVNEMQESLAVQLKADTPNVDVCHMLWTAIAESCINWFADNILELHLRSHRFHFPACMQTLELMELNQKSDVESRTRLVERLLPELLQEAEHVHSLMAGVPPKHAWREVADFGVFFEVKAKDPEQVLVQVNKALKPYTYVWVGSSDTIDAKVAAVREAHQEQVKHRSQLEKMVGNSEGSKEFFGGHHRGGPSRRYASGQCSGGAEAAGRGAEQMPAEG
jgi:hypothetical protein